MRRLLSLLILLSLSFTKVSAQNTEVEKMIRQYVKLINELNETKDETELLALFSPDFKSLISTTALSGKSNTMTGNIETQKNTFKRVMSYETIDVNLKIEGISNVSQNDGKGSLTAKLSSLVYIDGKEHEKNSYQIDATIKKDESGKWVFDYFFVDRTLEERKRGICVAYFYERKENYIVEINYPAVSDYKKAYYPFRFEVLGDERIITQTEKDYIWQTDNTVMYEFDESVLEGEATTKKEAVGIILNDYYKEQCSEILLR